MRTVDRLLGVAIASIVFTGQLGASSAAQQEKPTERRDPVVVAQKALTDPSTVYVDVTNQASVEIDAIAIEVRFNTPGAKREQLARSYRDYYMAIGLDLPEGEGPIGAGATRRFAVNLGTESAEVVEAGASVVIYRDGHATGDKTVMVWFINLRAAEAKEVGRLIAILDRARIMAPDKARMFIEGALASRKQGLRDALLSESSETALHERLAAVLKAPNEGLAVAIVEAEQYFVHRKANADRPVIVRRESQKERTSL